MSGLAYEDVRRDMVRCALDHRITHRTEATADDLRRRYGFTEEQVAAHAAAAIAEARRQHAGAVTHIAGGNGAAIPVPVMNSGEVTVQYRQRDGYHIFTSQDVYGLYTASRNLRQAWDAIAPALQALLKWDHGADCDIQAVMTLDEFVAMGKPGCLSFRKGHSS